MVCLTRIGNVFSSSMLSLSCGLAREFFVLSLSCGLVKELSVLFLSCGLVRELFVLSLNCGLVRELLFFFPFCQMDFQIWTLSEICHQIFCVFSFSWESQETGFDCCLSSSSRWKQWSHLMNNECAFSPSSSVSWMSCQSSFCAWREKKKHYIGKK